MLVFDCFWACFTFAVDCVVSGAVIQLLTTRSIPRWTMAAELVSFNIISYPFNTQVDEQMLICKV